MGRTNKKYMRVYIDGYDMSGYSRDAGTIGQTWDVSAEATLTDAVKNALVGQVTINAGPINAVLDNDGTTYPEGMFSTFKVAGGAHYLAVPIGTLAVPTIGDPMFAWRLNQTSFQVAEGSGFVSVTLGIDQAYPRLTAYNKPFGKVLHGKGAETAANTSDTPDCIDWGGSSARGGIFVWQLFTASGGAGAGNVTISMDDSDDGSTGWAAVTGATSGALTTGNTDALTASQAGMVELGKTATIKQFTRWQVAFTTQTTATFFAGFIRNT